jgi:hypothetical protein
VEVNWGMDKCAGKLFLMVYIFVFLIQIAYAIETGKEQEETRTDIASLAWSGSKMQLFLYYPNGTMLSPFMNNSMVRHVTGPTYDYYLLKNLSYGQWKMEVLPVDVPVEGETYSLATGPVDPKSWSQQNKSQQNKSQQNKSQTK